MGAEPGHGREQLLRISFAGMAEDRQRAALFDDPAALHDNDAIGHFGDDAHVVGDEDDRGAEFLFQLAHQFEDLCLHRHVERRRRFVGNQHFRSAGERHGDHHALAHAAGKFVRILRKTPARLGDLHRLQHLSCNRHGGVALAALMFADRFGELGADRHHRIE